MQRLAGARGCKLVEYLDPACQASRALHRRLDEILGAEPRAPRPSRRLRLIHDAGLTPGEVHDQVSGLRLRLASPRLGDDERGARSDQLVVSGANRAPPARP